ncbi:MAG: hypothetical protein ACE366_02445 [Bradymonadia bacterium]
MIRIHSLALIATLLGCAPSAQPTAHFETDEPTVAPALPAPKAMSFSRSDWQQVDPGHLSSMPVEEADVCMEWCLPDGCVLMCIDDALIAAQHPEYAPGAEGCTVCGRETGFRDNPEFAAPEVEVRLDGVQAVLTWPPIEEAHQYAVFMLRWSIEEDGEPPADADDLRRASRLARKVVFTEQPRVDLTLGHDEHYVVQVVGLDPEGTWISAPSTPIQLHAAE